MKKALTLLAAAVAFTAFAQREQVTANYQIVPLPAEITLEADAPGFKLDKKTQIYYEGNLAKEAAFLADYIKPLTGLDLQVTTKKPKTNFISLEIEPSVKNPEGYVIDVDKNCIEVEGGSAAGVFYALQTLRKSIPGAGEHDVLYPEVKIADAPRFGYRGAHLDVCRHFFPADSIKTFIDMMALHNMNTMHWHLTEDQGWRIEIEKYPLLTEIGSKRSGSIIGHTKEYDNVPVEGYYTKDQIRDIIAYAADRHITIIPEVDLPGHMVAALASYNNLGCTGGPYEVRKRWGISDDVLCAGNDEVYTFLDGVLGEVADLFPSEYIHIGGDECPKGAWKNCPKCQAKIKELGIVADDEHTAEEKLQSHVITHVENFLASKGKKIIGWDEILEGGLAPNATVMSWRGEKGGIKASAMGHDVIMTPNTYMYFDYYQLDPKLYPELPIAASYHKELPLEQVYSYEPTPGNFTLEQASHIKGVQSNIWTEYIPTFAQVQYQALPRWAAVSEIQWSPKGEKNYESFFERVKNFARIYDSEGYNYCRLVFEPKREAAPAK